MLALVAIALVAQAVLSPAPNQALPPAPPASVKSDRGAGGGDGGAGESDLVLLDAQMRTYFAGEQHEAWAWLGAGLAAAGVGTGLTLAPGDVAHGASYPLLDISVVQFGAAAWLLWRTHAQVERLSLQLARDPCGFFAEEPARMKRVNRGFSIYLPVETATLVGGAAMMGAGFTGKHDFLAGAGLGLIAQSVVMMLFDEFAGARAQTYQAQLEKAASAHQQGCPAPAN